ncbi:MAG: hypothetical protein NPIRA02_13490 [Nitrospirales bacterium]|nr:MAG: hypothetical protein NPIRA02_13490 [Nitrospirales bacterium]
MGVVVVPSGSAGSLTDPSLETMLRVLGFPEVTSLAELETRELGDALTVTSIPFLGEHVDLDVRTKMIPLVELSGRRFMFATDVPLVEPALFERLGDAVNRIDALFVGMECMGAPLTWLYGPLLDQRPTREHDQSRRLNGSDAAMANELARIVGARRIYAYAMGYEPWFRHLTGSDYDVDSEQYRQVGLLVKPADARSIPTELLHLSGERIWSTENQASNNR